MSGAPVSVCLPPTSISDSDFETVRSIVYQRIGLSLSPSKRALVVSRLGRHLKDLRIAEFGEYIKYIQKTPQAFEEMIGRITTHFTGFFRERIQFDILHREILPQVVKRRHKAKRLRIWSAACSSGEELYSILIEVLDFMGGRIPGDWDIKILGTDIDQRSLETAQKGVYPRTTVLPLGDVHVNRYFDELSDGTFAFKPLYRDPLRFAQFNLMSLRYPFRSPMDIVFCRNVAIYFDNEGKDHLYRTIHHHLAADGFLFSGHSESLLRYPDLFTPLKRSIYTRKNDQTV